MNKRPPYWLPNFFSNGEFVFKTKNEWGTFMSRQISAVKEGKIVAFISFSAFYLATLKNHDIDKSTLQSGMR